MLEVEKLAIFFGAREGQSPKQKTNTIKRTFLDIQIPKMSSKNRLLSSLGMVSK